MYIRRVPAGINRVCVYTVMCCIEIRIGIIIIIIDIYDVLIMTAVHNKLPGNSVARARVCVLIYSG